MPSYHRIGTTTGATKELSEKDAVNRGFMIVRSLVTSLLVESTPIQQDANIEKY